MRSVPTITHAQLHSLVFVQNIQIMLQAYTSLPFVLSASVNYHTRQLVKQFFTFRQISAVHLSRSRGLQTPLILNFVGARLSPGRIDNTIAPVESAQWTGFIYFTFCFELISKEMSGVLKTVSFFLFALLVLLNMQILSVHLGDVARGWFMTLRVTEASLNDL